MVSEIKIVNETLGEQIIINQEPNSVLLLNQVDWGTMKVKHNTTNFPNQIGKYLSNTTLEDRDISISGFVVSEKFDRTGMTLEQIWEKSKQNIDKTKMLLSRILNPLYDLKIIVGDFVITGRPDMSIEFSKDKKDNNEVYCLFDIDIYSPEGLFYYRLKTENVVAGTIPLFHFPLEIPKEERPEQNIGRGIIFGIKNEGTLVGIKNEGDVEIGGIIKIEALTTVNNLKIYNDITKQFFKINKRLEKGEIIVINTEMGNEGIYGYVDYHKYNYFKYVDSDSTWLQYKPGISSIGYTSDEGNSYGLVNITINVQGKYYSFPDM